jgi:ATP-dependent RNA helicase SUPV3L1/SUV3
LLALLWAVHARLDKIPSPPAAGITSFTPDENANAGVLAACGFGLIGTRAVRLDILDRLEEQLEQAAATGRSADDVFPRLVSFLGCDRDTLEAVLKALNWSRVEVADPSAPGAVWRHNANDKSARKSKQRRQPRGSPSPFSDLAVLVAAD